jgi:hypothetical protein
MYQNGIELSYLPSQGSGSYWMLVSRMSWTILSIIGPIIQASFDVSSYKNRTLTQIVGIEPGQY